MESETKTNMQPQPKPHFVLVPLLAPGHLLPMIDMARLLAEHGSIVSLVTTPFNAARTASPLLRSNLPIRVLEIPFPSQWAGLPPGCENLDTLPSKHLIRNFYAAMDRLQAPLERLLDASTPPPSCIISDKCLSWTSKIAQRFEIPRIVFHGMCCFSLLAAHNIRLHKSHLAVASPLEPFPIPGMPCRVEIAKYQLPGSFVTLPDLDDIRDQMQEAESSSFGVVVNTFHGLEGKCITAYQTAIQKRVWCIGPVSLCNNNNNNEPSINEIACLRWLDRKEIGSVVYACLGSQCRLVPEQLIELGLGLEASNRPFVWVIKTSGSELDSWLKETEFEERVKGRGLVIRVWAPQVLILSHRAVGGFVTHCGWNSVIEGVSGGVAMVTWPQFAEQFLNEKLVVEVLEIGVRVGVEMPVRFGDEEKVGVLVKRGDVERAVEEVMTVDGEWRRKRARELGEVAKEAAAVSGSSHSDISRLVQDIVSCMKFGTPRLNFGNYFSPS